MRIDEFTRASIEHPERNEDAYVILAGDAETAPIFAMIDGMGGHQRTRDDGTLVTGRDASSTVRQVLLEELSQLPAEVSAERDGVAEQKLFGALDRANEAIFSQFNNDEGAQGKRVGAVATIVIVCENGTRLLAAQIGDTRAYVYSMGEFIQVLEDEDNVSYLVQNGIMTEEDGQRVSHILNTFDGINEPDAKGTINIFGQDYDLHNAWRWFVVGNPALHIAGSNAVLSALGIDEDCPYPQTARMPINAGDALFLCSDGIYKNLSHAEIVGKLAAAPNPAQSAGESAFARSQDTFNRRSTVDDISAVYVKF
jgi:serine/threonine protein phosphatase PrpC